MNRRDMLKATGAGLAAAALPRWAGAAPAFARSPNIVLILTDDVGLGDIGCCGGPFATPRIDALAKGGTRFELCYSTPLCGPSRCQLLTGRYPFRTGLNTNNSRDAVSPTREVMIPTVMKKAGYTTAHCGKWGQICLGPKEWGFDEYLVWTASGRYWASQRGGYNLNGQARNLGAREYMPDVMHDFAVDFIKRQQGKPFFLYYPMSHVHGPIVRTPDSAPKASASQLYQDNVAYMDKLVGRLVDDLERLKLRDNTLILFTGDNGTARFGVQAATVNGKAISGQKGTMLEGGARVPLIANWPRTTPAAMVNHDLIDFSDFFVTCAELADAKLPDGVTLDGQSFAAPLRGATGKPREWVYVELNGRSYARDAKYKLTNTGDLFDLSDAPYQEKPVAKGTTDADATASRARLQAVLDTHRAAAGQPAAKKQAKRAKKQRKKQQRQQEQ